MAYNKFTYNGITGITAGLGVENIVTVVPPLASYDKILNLDITISGYGAASIPECSAVARYMNTYFVSSGGTPSLLNQHTICEYVRGAGGPPFTWVYSEAIVSDEIVIRLDTSNWGTSYCLYSIIGEY